MNFATELCRNLFPQYLDALQRLTSQHAVPKSWHRSSPPHECSSRCPRRTWTVSVRCPRHGTPCREPLRFPWKSNSFTVLRTVNACLIKDTVVLHSCFDIVTRMLRGCRLYRDLLSEDYFADNLRSELSIREVNCETVSFRIVHVTCAGSSSNERCGSPDVSTCPSPLRRESQLESRLSLRLFVPVPQRRPCSGSTCPNLRPVAGLRLARCDDSE